MSSMTSSDSEKWTTPRKVLAQRKFAQGAYVPPSAGPQPSTSAAAVAPERRELPVTADRGQNIIHNNVSAKSLLDVLSFTAVSHAKLSPLVVKPSDSPVVMVQRLPERSLQHCREKTASENNVKNRAATASVVNSRANRIARKSRHKVSKLVRHSMRLRSVRRRPKWMNCAPELSNVFKSPEDVKLNKCPPPQPAETLQVAKPIEPKSPLLKKKKITHKKKSRFTLDDNRPLKYLMKSNGSPNAEDVQSHQSAGTASTSHKEAMQPVADVGMVMRRRKSRMTNINKAVRRRRKSGIARTSLKEVVDPSADIEMEVRGHKSAPTMMPLEATKVILEKLPIAVQERMDTNYQKNQERMDTNYQKKGTARTSHRESMETPADTDMTVRRRKSGTKIPPHKEALEPSADIDIAVPRRKSDHASQSTAVVQPEVRTELKQAPGVKADACTNSAGLLGASPLEPQVKTVAIASSTPFNYSSAQGIHRWLDGNVLVEHILQIEDDDDDVIIVLPGDCPSLKWNTINEAAIAPASQFLSRCKVCQHCQRIEKVVRLTALLKRQRRIECLTDEPVAGPSTDPDYSIVKEEDESFITELLPRHPHLMIKIPVTTTGQSFACLIPRSEAKGTAEFNLVEKEPILDQMIESLSLSLGDAPSKQIGVAVDKNVPCSKQVQDGTEAPIFYPTVAEFQDPFKYIEKIWHRVTRFGLCKIVPPEGFVPTCNIAEEIRFAVSNQYVNRLFNRWGEASKTIGAISACLKSHNVDLKQAQMIQGVETNLVKLMQTVDKNGGIQTVINKKKWTKIAEDMNISKHPHVRRKLEVLYYKALLPFCTLTVEEREEYFKAMDLYWKTTNAKLLKRARNPLYRRNRLLGATDSSSDSDYDMEYEEECVHHTGATMNVAGFKKISGIVYDQLYNTKAVSLKDYERDYWDRVQSGSEHICVNSASIDTGEAGYGFTKNPSDEYSHHPWNLKVLSQNSANMLRPLGAVVGVTVPTLHLGMIFSTSCWHRDPHGLPWIEYLHHGEPKIWYSVPENQDAPFRAATESLCPIAVQNKSIWLPSDIAMIPPDVLRARDVTVCRTEQLAGEFILVMPKAYSCSFSTGYGVSESTYLATRRWLPNLLEIFSEIRESSEPTMFSLEQLLKLTAEDEKTELPVLQIIQPTLVKVFTQEIENRQLLLEMGIELVILESTQTSQKEPKAQEDGRATGSEQTSAPTAWNVRDENECEYCRCPLYLSEVRNLPSQGSTLCVEHALLLLRQPKYSTVEVSSLQMVYSYSIEQLRRTLKTVENRLATGGRV